MTIQAKDNVNPLVSVCIITYNSSKYVLEALESVYNQSYKNIQLVVSDDGSIDDTVSKVEKWVEDKGRRFESVKVLTVEKNTGTSKNSNRGLQASDGEWFKYFAGDDVLLPNAIERYVKFVSQNPETKWIYAKAVCYVDSISEDNQIWKKHNRYDDAHAMLNSMTNEEQFKKMQLINYLNFPTHFINTNLFLELGGFDEDFFLLEDYPTWLKFLSYGVHCSYLDEYVVGYRKSNDNVFNSTKRIVNMGIERAMYNTRKKYVYCRSSFSVRLYSDSRYCISRFFALPFINNKPQLAKLYMWILAVLRITFSRSLW